MDFASSFLQSFKVPPHLTSDLNETALCETLYKIHPNTCKHLMTVYSRAGIDAGYPFYYAIKGLDCFCILYTLSGTGRLESTLENRTYLTVPSSMMLFDCRQPFTLETAAAPWKFRILFVNGGNLPFYMQLAEGPFGCMLENVASGDLLFFLNMLFQGSTEKDLIHKIEDEKNLTNLCAAFFSKYLTKDSKPEYIPDYLLEMKNLFDTHFEQSYSLDVLESRLGVSKYRLCREFSARFHESPIQYLNRVRINNSKLLLQNTDLKIHEIGAKVGIENTNHFIHLFKRQEGTTPLIYKSVARQRHF